MIAFISSLNYGAKVLEMKPLQVSLKSSSVIILIEEWLQVIKMELILDGFLITKLWYSTNQIVSNDYAFLKLCPLSSKQNLQHYGQRTPKNFEMNFTSRDKNIQIPKFKINPKRQTNTHTQNFMEFRFFFFGCTAKRNKN